MLEIWLPAMLPTGGSKMVRRNSSIYSYFVGTGVSRFSCGTTLRFAGLFVAILLTLAGASPVGVASAQTAHFSGAVSTFGSGLFHTFDVAVDGSGNVFVADYGHNAIKEILAAGGYTTVNTLGSGFYYPTSAAVDGSGNVFVADGGNSAIKEILAAGGYTTVNTLGSGFQAPHGVAVDGSGNVFVADTDNNAVKEILAAGGYTTVKTLGSGFVYPWKVAVDGGGNVFVADYGNNAVKEILAVGGYTAVNTLGSGFTQPWGVAVDGSGNVFVADQGNNAVKEIVAGTGGAASGTVSSSSTVTVLGSGFVGPTGVAVDNNGNIFVAEYGNNAVKKIATRTVNFGQVSVGSTTPTVSLTFYFDTGGTIAVPAVLTQGAAGKDFADAGTGTCTSNGTLHVYNAGDTCTVDAILTPTAPGLRLGAGEILDGSSNNLATVYMSGTGVGPQINFFPGVETLVSVTGSTHLVGAAVDAAGNLYSGDSTLMQVHQVAGGSTYLVADLSANAIVPQNLAVDGAGNVLISDPNNGKVWTVPPGATLHTFGAEVVLTSALTEPEGVAVDGDGNIYIADAGSKSILKMSRTAAGAYGAPSPISTITPLISPYGIEMDGAGNLYIADFGGNRILIKFASGVETIVQTNLNLPKSVAVDDNGNIYIANSGDANILRAPQTAPGVWGTPTAVATTTALAGPTGVAVDSTGNLYITDSGVTQVIEKQYATAPTYTFGTATPLGFDYSGRLGKHYGFEFGNAPLTAVAPGLTPAPDFPQTGGTCSTAFSLAANDICTLNIGFHPLTAGALNNEHFTLTDNNLGVSPSLQSITLSGVGIPLLGFGVNPATPVSLGGNAGVVKVNELGATFALIPTATDSITLVVTGPAGYTATYSATAVSGVATFDLSAVQLSKAGSYGYVAHLTSVTGGPTASVTEVVNQAAPTIVVTSAGTPTTYGTPVTFSATVTGVAGNGNPSGNVVFYSDGTAILSCGGATGLAVTAGAGVTASVDCTTSALTGNSNGHSVTAQYLGDTAYGTSAMSNSLTQKVNVTSSVVTISLTTGTTPANYGTPLVFTATVYGVSGLASATGTVTFVDGVTPIACTNAPSNVTATTPGMATATCNISTLGAGSHSITARYVPGSDPNYSGNDSSALAQDVNSLATTLALVSSAPAQSSVNQSVTFTATVTVTAPPLPPALAPTGSVSFTINGSSSPDCPNATLSPTLTATCTTSSLKTPSGAIRATYIPDANYSASSAGPLTQTVTALTPTLSMNPSPASPQPLNTSVTFTATLSGATLTPVVPVGTVTFTLNGTTVAGCTGTVNSAGVRTCVIQNMPAGSTPVTATYSGDTNFVVAAPGSTTFSVNALPGTLSITPSPVGSVITGTSVTFTAQLAASSLSPITPSGTVTFTVNGSSNADCPPETVTAGGAATCTTSSLQVPSDVIQATYSGDTNFTPVTAGTLTETVAKSPAQTTLTSSLPSAAVNQQVTFTATVKPQSGTVLPTGSATFAQGTTTLCSAVAINSSTGIATCSYPFASVTAGATITATYSGDQNFDTGTPGTSAQVVVASSTTITIASAPNPSTVNQQVALTAVLTPTYTAGNAKPTGTVTFTNTSTTPTTTLCAGLAIVNGVVPVCNYAFPSAGEGNLVATFTPGDSNFTGSVSSTDPHPINAAATTVVLTTSPSPVVVNQQTTLTAAINTVSGTTKPQGTVIYTDTLTSTTLCTVTLTAAGSAPTCPYSFSTTGTHTITAAFTTLDSNFLSAVSTVLSVPVNQATTTTSVTSSPNSSTVNQQVAFTASVTPSFTTGTAKPTGTVTFVNTSTTPATTLCAGLTIANGIVPVCNFTFSSAGSSNVVATYNGDSNFSLSSSAPAGDVQVVATGSTALVLTSTPSNTTANQQVTFTATVTATPSGGAGLSGTVAFTDNGSAISGCSSVPVVPATGVATCLTASMTAGSNTILATYSSDPNFGSSNNTIVQTPSKLTPALGLSGTGASNVGAPVTLTAQLSGVPLTPNAPTGTAAFTSNGVTISDCAAAPVDLSGKAICTTSALGAGSDTIGAVFSGDTNFSTAAAQSIKQTVAKIAPTMALALTSGSTPSAFGTILTFTATTTGVAAVSSPTGTVSFTDGGAALACLNAPGVLTAAGSGMSTATCNVSALNVGSHQIAATYEPGTDLNYLAAGPSAPVSQTVNQAAPKLLLTCAVATYDGNAHSCIGSATGISGETVAGSWSYSPASSINAGSSSFTGTFTSSDANYANGTAGGSLVIDPATTLLTLTCTETTYDGSAHSCIGSAKGVGGVTVARDLELHSFRRDCCRQYAGNRHIYQERSELHQRHGQRYADDRQGYSADYLGDACVNHLRHAIGQYAIECQLSGDWKLQLFSGCRHGAERRNADTDGDIDSNRFDRLQVNHSNSFSCRDSGGADIEYPLHRGRL